MPLYFFHLSFGNRLTEDEEGVELPSRAAALREAFAVARDLSDPAAGGHPRRWAGWFLQVADERDTIVRAPIGYPALETAEKAAVSRRPGRPGAQRHRPAHSRLSGQLAAVAKRVTAQRKRTADLLEWNRRVRAELSSQMLACQNTRRLMSRPFMAGGDEMANSRPAPRAAAKPAGGGRPHLTLLQGGR
jgi:hypothetical protein